MREEVVELLKAIGYEATPEDDWMINFSTEKATHWVLTGCNLKEIPIALHEVAVQRAAGEFLMVKKASGGLTGIDMSAPAKEIKEGDMSISFAFGAGSLTPEQRLDAAIAFFLKGDNGQFAVFRRLRW